ncbi:MAG: hypothetical protein ACMXYF_03085 [Candidatus Woesearchaeota archaeon]
MIKNWIKQLPYEQLQQLEQLQKTGELATLLIKQKQLIELQSKSVCATCGAFVCASPKTYTLVFGPEDFKKKASFCGHDCLVHFTKYLETFEKPSLKENV